ncbi:MAG: digeranylgeranylglycerophospholipid reductase [Methanobacteriales archaeon HGW-Methanobacteriales-1]|jgi:digeranylgeranylglycerophospholipid reductase|nr:MAG: digeranylgeranylglycerophospholipid reductase [Methanobacteriales archaeon HGW-Methanobacteriales-1]
MNYDVIVVGGRVSGSIASMYASKNGANVLMIEKHQEIGTPVQCAGGVSDSFFKKIDISPSSEYTLARVKGATIYSPDGNSVTSKNKILKGRILERKNFDKNLAIQSANAGTEIMLKTTVKGLITENGQVKGVVAKHLGKTWEIPAKIVIAADGIESNMAQFYGLKNRFKPKDICSCAQFEMVGLDVDPEMMKFYFGQKIAPGGYAWIFPKGDNRANVGLGIRSSQGTAYHYLQKFAENLGGKKVEFNVGAVPIGGPIQKTYGNGLIVVGDAAGQVDPVTGGGIHVSAECAKIAGIVAAEAVQKEDYTEKSLKNYEKIWKKQVGKNLEKALRFRKIFDKLNDEDINNLLKSAKNNDIDSISKLSILKLLKGYPELLKLLRTIL